MFFLFFFLFPASGQTSGIKHKYRKVTSAFKTLLNTTSPVLTALQLHEALWICEYSVFVERLMTTMCSTIDHTLLVAA